ncbi:MAG: hypothetical protein U9Q22_05550, partial [Candidatus Altiarchaeota archaeon]|nr:hypothetical protein [Candidatus Altiarchaeota archaeon]
MNKKILWITVILLLTCNVDAVKVGVVVQFPDGEVFKECRTVSEDTNGYDIMQGTDLDITWSAPGPWGHGLCAIND